jgi:cytochrome c-type biogenesis protein CcmH
MSLTLAVWLLLASSMSILALLILPLLSDATRLALVSRLRLPSRTFGQDLRGTAGTLMVSAAVFFLVAGFGAAASYLAKPRHAAGAGHTRSFSEPHSGPDGEMLASLKDYTRAIGNEQPAPGRLLPDVNTMIDQLAARLETTPEDIKGWRMLGWSYFHTGRYKQAAAAYEKAAALDPNSAEIKASYEEAKTKASETEKLAAAPSSQSEAAGKRGDGLALKQDDKSDATPPHEAGAAIRSMVDGLAARLESSPRDVQGWTRLMRSRVVLGESEAAATAFRRALEVFKDDPAASGKIAAAANELGLKSE